MMTNILCTKVSWIDSKFNTFFLVLSLSMVTYADATAFQEVAAWDNCHDSLIIEVLPCDEVAYDLEHKATQENFILTFEHENKGTFSITLYDFGDEAVRVLIHDAMTGEELYAINLEPSEDIYKSNLLAKALPSGTYYVVVKGESRIIPKEITIQ